MLYILPTIDTEGVHGDKPFERMILGDVDNGSINYGVEYLIKQFKKYRINATFFIDIYEISLWGYEKMKLVCDLINDNKFDIQLHTHPGWRKDPQDTKYLQEYKKRHSYLSQEKDMMTKLSLEEQSKIIKEGIELIESITKKKIIAHRSGGYSINKLTVKALKENNIYIDSSMNISHKNSRINWSLNAPCSKGEFLEIPITNMIYKSHLPIPKIYEYKKALKTDIDIGSFSELSFYIDYMKNKKDNSIMNLFMHSYSLLKFDNRYKVFKPDPKKIIRLEKLLQYIYKLENVKIMDISSFSKLYNLKLKEEKWIDEIPEKYSNMKILNLAIRKFKNKIINYSS